MKTSCYLSHYLSHYLGHYLRLYTNSLKRPLGAGLLLGCLIAPLLATSVYSASPVAEHLAAAVRFATISHQDEERLDRQAFLGLARFLRKTYPLTFSKLQVETIGNYSLLIIWPGTDKNRKKSVLFTAHMDVVPTEPGTEADWTHPAFAGVIADGRVYGRGTLDDKEGVIILLEATERLLAEGFQPERTLALGFGHDEEIGGHKGAKQIAARLLALGMHFEWMVDEGGFIFSDNPILPGQTGAAISVVEKVYATLVLRAEGQGGHSSRPAKRTTIGRLAEAVAKVEKNPFPPRLTAPVKAMLTRSAPYYPFFERLVLSNLWLTGSFVAKRMAQSIASKPLVQTTTAVTLFHAGVKENVIPQSAEAKINFRLLPGDTPAMLLERVTEIVDDPSIQITFIAEPTPSAPVAAVEGGGFDIIGQAAKSVYPDVIPLPTLMFAATDTRHYVEVADNHYRFHGILVDNEQFPGIHGTDEWIGIESLERGVDIAAEMMRLAGQ